MTFTRLTVEIWPESVSECHLEPCDGDEVCPTFPGEHSRHGGVVQAGLAGNVSEAPASDGGAEALGELVGVMHLGWAFDAPIRPLAFNQVRAGRSIEAGTAREIFEAVKADLVAFSPPADDISLIVIKRR